MPGAFEPGAFASVRATTYHTGVDLYTRPMSDVFAVEDSTIVACGDFTGPTAGSPWYLDTGFIMAEGPSGVVCYGEIGDDSDLSIRVGDHLKAGDRVGWVRQVLKRDKGFGTSMLHLELYKHNTRLPVDWPRRMFPMSLFSRPSELLDPTPHLVSIDSEYDCTLRHVILHSRPGSTFRIDGTFYVVSRRLSDQHIKAITFEAGLSDSELHLNYNMSIDPECRMIKI